VALTEHEEPSYLAQLCKAGAAALDYFAPLRTLSTVGGLTAPRRLTAESATTSGGALFQTRVVLVAGRISPVHLPPLRVCNNQSHGLLEPLGAQRISSREPDPPLETIRLGFPG
jgi:hypothetical protein